VRGACKRPADKPEDRVREQLQWALKEHGL